MGYMKWINGIITEGEVDSLREAYLRAVKDKKKEFRWSGSKYVTGFAKYVLEYIDMELKRKKS
tara:strand:- start:1810 stop:1998 length:189 start_codon:yes stop_codon:yes gene_type:complete